MKDMQENRASWINFLSLRAAHRYRVVTESREPVAQEVGEVMEIVVDPTFPPPEEFKIEETVISQKDSRWMGHWKQPKVILGPPPSSPGKKSSESPTPNPMPPSTDSDSIKAKTELTSGMDKEKSTNHAPPGFRGYVLHSPTLYIAVSPSAFSKRQCYAHDTKEVGELVSGLLLGKAESKPDEAEGSVREKRNEMREWQLRYGRLPNPGARPVSPTSPSSPDSITWRFWHLLPALQLGQSRAKSRAILTPCDPRRGHRPPMRGRGPLLP